MNCQIWTSFINHLFDYNRPAPKNPSGFNYLNFEAGRRGNVSMPRKRDLLKRYYGGTANFIASQFPVNIKEVMGSDGKDTYRKKTGGTSYGLLQHG